MNPTTSEIRLIEKESLAGKVTGIHVQVKLSRVITNNPEPYVWIYDAVLDPTAEVDLKVAIEKWLTGGIVQNFDKNADSLELEFNKPKPIKQVIDKSTVPTLDLTIKAEVDIPEDPDPITP